MHPQEEEALEAIRAEYAEEVIYTGAGLDAAPVMAIFTNAAGLPFQGPGATVRKTNFEIAQSALPEDPRKTNTIRQGADGKLWRVNDITRRDDIGAWVIYVEEGQP